MKDIYELLNDAKIDDQDIEEMPVTELEKAKVKNALKQSISKKKKRKGWKTNVVAAAAVIGLTITTVGLTFPAYAGNIPIIGDIFRFLDNDKTGMYDNYKEFSTEMNLTQESNGIKITVNDAVFDGETVAITYSIDSDHDLGEELTIDMADIKGSNGRAGTSKITKIDDNHYVGLDRITPIGLTSETVHIKWNINNLYLMDTGNEVKGKWKFAFSLQATDSQVQLTNQTIEQNGVTVNIEKIAVTPMSFIIHYNQAATQQVQDKWHEASIKLHVTDDLGNTYSGEGNGGSGPDAYTISWSDTFEKLDPNATKLIITPHITFRIHDASNFSSVEITEDGKERVLPIPPKTGVGKEEFVMEDIVIELEK
ncbi:DUF4179 domain-containing protein [Sporosarcina sp. ACRSM]|uniref:DUF4179 domain-containing protein n=1 Tax=Sporosarcina sp. ACRSM TaxID=2918216 RepID=UPI001EF6C405|nr:DUF4179 domain-containing protein [Sporosarcina sp. ACRSM]MCG7336754.1 DUF4179 domain-containing protein [Sporosarcina sp. ACRSM]